MEFANLQVRCQAINLTKDDLLPTGFLVTKCSDIWIKVSVTKIQLKFCAKWRPFCLALNITVESQKRQCSVSNHLQINCLSRKKISKFRITGPFARWIHRRFPSQRVSDTKKNVLVIMPTWISTTFFFPAMEVEPEDPALPPPPPPQELMETPGENEYAELDNTYAELEPRPEGDKESDSDSKNPCTIEDATLNTESLIQLTLTSQDCPDIEAASRALHYEINLDARFIDRGGFNTSHGRIQQEVDIQAKLVRFGLIDILCDNCLLFIKNQHLFKMSQYWKRLSELIREKRAELCKQ